MLEPSKVLIQPEEKTCKYFKYTGGNRGVCTSSGRKSHFGTRGGLNIGAEDKVDNNLYNNTRICMGRYYELKTDEELAEQRRAISRETAHNKSK